MKKHEIFETNPNLKEVHMTSDGQAFYNDNDAKMHAKTLEDKKVELVLNPSFLSEIEVIDEEELSASAEQKLEDLTKAELVEFAKVNFELELNAKDNKPVLLAAIEAKVKELSKGADATLKVIDEKNVDQLKTSTANEEENKAIDGNVDGSANELVSQDANKTDKDQE